MSQITAEKVLKDSRLNKKISENILCSILNINKAKLFLEKNRLILSGRQIEKFNKIERKIIKDQPPQYALGEAEFYGRTFTINRNVLIPRPESELLVEHGLKYLRQNFQKKLRIIDVGCGSGCLIISLIKELGEKKYLKNFKFYAAEISPAALRVAKANAKRHHVEQIKFYRSDLFSNSKLPEKFDSIVANLPYLPVDYLKTLPNSIVKNLQYEPKTALSGGRDGLYLIKKLIRLLPQKLDRDGLALIEFDPPQTNAIKKLLNKIGLKHQIVKDLNGRDRLCAISSQIYN